LELTAPLLDEVITSTVRNDAKNFVTRERINSIVWRDDDLSNQADQKIPTACSLAKLSIQRRAGTP